MSGNRRDFIKSSAALTVITVSKASAQAPTTRTIGVVHSTQFDEEARRCLVAGLGSKGWQEDGGPKPMKLSPKNAEARYGGTHGRQVLRQLIKQHVAGKVHLIVAAGGGTSQGSAFDELSQGAVPFVYITGRIPLPPSSTDGRYCGISLDISGRYYEALDYFYNQFNIARSDVWLVINANSGDAQQEYNNWPNQNYVFGFFATASNPHTSGADNPYPPTDNNVTTAFRREIGKLKSKNPKAIVVSPDPLFRMKATIFAAEMKRPNTGLPSNTPICYPFKDFAPSAPDFQLPRAAAVSSATATDPNAAYYQAGVLAGAALDKQTPTQPISSAPETSLRWDGSAWIPA